MTYRPTEMGRMVRENPERARLAILAAIRRAGGMAKPPDARGHRAAHFPASVGKVAAALGVSRASLVLWLRALGIGDSAALSAALAPRKRG